MPGFFARTSPAATTGATSGAIGAAGATSGAAGGTTGGTASPRTSSSRRSLRTSKEDDVKKKEQRENRNAQRENRNASNAPHRVVLYRPDYLAANGTSSSNPNSTSGPSTAQNIIYTSRTLLTTFPLLEPSHVHRVCTELSQRGEAILGTWTRSDCLVIEEKLKALEVRIDCRVVPVAGRDRKKGGGEDMKGGEDAVGQDGRDGPRLKDGAEQDAKEHTEEQAKQDQQAQQNQQQDGDDDDEEADDVAGGTGPAQVQEASSAAQAQAQAQACAQREQASRLYNAGILTKDEHDQMIMVAERGLGADSKSEKEFEQVEKAEGANEEATEGTEAKKVEDEVAVHQEEEQAKATAIIGANDNGENDKIGTKIGDDDDGIQPDDDDDDEALDDEQFHHDESDEEVAAEVGRAASKVEAQQEEAREEEREAQEKAEEEHDDGTKSGNGNGGSGRIIHRPLLSGIRARLRESKSRSLKDNKDDNNKSDEVYKEENATSTPEVDTEQAKDATTPKVDTEQAQVMQAKVQAEEEPPAAVDTEQPQDMQAEAEEEQTPTAAAEDAAADAVAEIERLYFCGIITQDEYEQMISVEEKRLKTEEGMGMVKKENNANEEMDVQSYENEDADADADAEQAQDEAQAAEAAAAAAAAAEIQRLYEEGILTQEEYNQMIQADKRYEEEVLSDTIDTTIGTNTSSTDGGATGFNEKLGRIPDLYDAYANRLDPTFWATPKLYAENADGSGSDNADTATTNTATPAISTHFATNFSSSSTSATAAALLNGSDRSFNYNHNRGGNNTLAEMNMIEFCRKFCVPRRGPHAGKIKYHRNGYITSELKFSPVYDSDKDGEEYGKYCRFSLVKYRPWIGSPFGMVPKKKVDGDEDDVHGDGESDDGDDSDDECEEEEEEEMEEYQPDEPECIKEWEAFLFGLQLRKSRIPDLLLPPELKGGAGGSGGGTTSSKDESLCSSLELLNMASQRAAEAAAATREEESIDSSDDEDTVDADETDDDDDNASEQEMEEEGTDVETANTTPTKKWGVSVRNKGAASSITAGDDDNEDGDEKKKENKSAVVKTPTPKTKRSPVSVQDTATVAGTNENAGGEDAVGGGTSLVLMVNDMLKNASPNTKNDYAAGVKYTPTNPRAQKLQHIYEKEERLLSTAEEENDDTAEDANDGTTIEGVSPSRKLDFSNATSDGLDKRNLSSDYALSTTGSTISSSHLANASAADSDTESLHEQRGKEVENRAEEIESMLASLEPVANSKKEDRGDNDTTPGDNNNDANDELIDDVLDYISEEDDSHSIGSFSVHDIDGIPDDADSFHGSSKEEKNGDDTKEEEFDFDGMLSFGEDEGDDGKNYDPNETQLNRFIEDADEEFYKEELEPTPNTNPSPGSISIRKKLSMRKKSTRISAKLLLGKVSKKKASPYDELQEDAPSLLSNDNAVAAKTSEIDMTSIVESTLSDDGDCGYDSSNEKMDAGAASDPSKASASNEWTPFVADFNGNAGEAPFVTQDGSNLNCSGKDDSADFIQFDPFAVLSSADVTGGGTDIFGAFDPSSGEVASKSSDDVGDGTGATLDAFNDAFVSARENCTDKDPTVAQPPLVTAMYYEVETALDFSRLHAQRQRRTSFRK